MLDSLKALFEDFGPIIEGSPTEEYEGTGANEIAKAYESHVQAMQQLSSTFIGKRLVLDPFTSLVHSFHDRLDDVESSEDVSNPSPGIFAVTQQIGRLWPRLRGRGHR